jgi:hypothetical protein
VLLRSCQPYSHHPDLSSNKSPDEHHFSLAKSVELEQDTADELHFLGENRNDILCTLVSSGGLDEGLEIIESREVLLSRRFIVSVVRIIIIQERIHIRNP